MGARSFVWVPDVPTQLFSLIPLDTEMSDTVNFLEVGLVRKTGQRIKCYVSPRATRLDRVTL